MFAAGNHWLCEQSLIVVVTDSLSLHCMDMAATAIGTQLSILPTRINGNRNVVKHPCEWNLKKDLNCEGCAQERQVAGK